jgi:hypothetical protein
MSSLCVGSPESQPLQTGPASSAAGETARPKYLQADEEEATTSPACYGPLSAFTDKPPINKTPVRHAASKVLEILLVSISDFIEHVAKRDYAG